MEINDKWSLSGFRLEPVQAEALLIFYPRKDKPKTKVIPKWELSTLQCKHWWSVIWHSCLPEGIPYVGATSLVCMMEVYRIGLHSPCMYGIYLFDTCYMGDCKSTWPRPEIDHSKEPTWVLNFMWFCDDLAWIMLVRVKQCHERLQPFPWDDKPCPVHPVLHPIILLSFVF